MPLLRITCPPELTEPIVHILHSEAGATELAVVAGTNPMSPGDLVLADVPRASVDTLLARFPDAGSVAGLHVAIVPSERLVPRVVAADDDDDEAVIWAQVVQDVHGTGHLSAVNILLVVIAAAIAAIGIIQDQLLLIVGAMALSPDYYPIADVCLSVVRGAWRRAAGGIGTLALLFGCGILGAWVLTAALQATGLLDASAVPSRQLTLFISRPDGLTVVVALLAGVAGAMAITLSDARGLVGVFVSITTIPAAANIGVALADRDWADMAGAAVQLTVNVASLIVAGTITLAIRRRFGQPATAPADR
jgi:uncharacterized hydrophobic protein (TIGR00271 family)